jgi:hypothetical protein
MNLKFEKFILRRHCSKICAAIAQNFAQKAVARSPLVNPEDARKEPGMLG